jgi:hypothetical protein
MSRAGNSFGLDRSTKIHPVFLVILQGQIDDVSDLREGETLEEHTGPDAILKTR